MKAYLRALAARLTAYLLRKTYNADHFRYWERQGYHVTPVHFYQPIPNTAELAQRYPPKSDLIGVRWNADGQLALLEQLRAYAPETERFPFHADPAKGDHFYLNNGLFMGIDPLIYHCLIRHFQPKQIIEIGAGFSTLLAAQATQGTITAVEPYPRPFIQQGAYGIRHISERVEDLPIAFFEQLQADDLLFIDSSHVVRTGGDVNYLILNVLPRLKAGVLVHLHDIFLPYEYPTAWILEKHWFWTEQYLLHAFLIHNPRVEIVLANHFLERDHADRLRSIFPKAPTWTGGSFWLRIL